MIKGVKIKQLTRHTDNRGYFEEILRMDDDLLKEFGQASISMTKPGIIKAFHWHKNQDDVFHVLEGKALVVLYDLKSKKKMIIKMDSEDPKILFIPKGVAHGYKALGKKPLKMLYLMNKTYNAKKPDEQRIDFNDKKINFNWEKY